MTDELREALAHLRMDHEALCALLIKGDMISEQRLAQERDSQRIVAFRRACPLPHVLDRKGVAVTLTRFMTRDDHASLRTTSKQLLCLPDTRYAVDPFRILMSNLKDCTEVFDTTSGRWEVLPYVGDGRSEVMSAMIRGRLYVWCGSKLMFLKKEKGPTSKQFDDDEWIRSLTEAQEITADVPEDSVLL